MFCAKLAQCIRVLGQEVEDIADGATCGIMARKDEQLCLSDGKGFEVLVDTDHGLLRAEVLVEVALQGKIYNGPSFPALIVLVVVLVDVQMLLEFSSDVAIHSPRIVPIHQRTHGIEQLHRDAFGAKAEPVDLAIKCRYHFISGALRMPFVVPAQINGKPALWNFFFGQCLLTMILGR